MQLNAWISVGSLTIAIIAFVYSYLTNTKKYELSSQYRKEVLAWYTETVKLLVEIRHKAESDDPAAAGEVGLRTRLSAQIELGRFYFPNVNKGDGFGDNKPLAYRGYRNIVLEFLVLAYKISGHKNPNQYADHLEALERQFTSEVFLTLDPKRFLTDTQRYAGKTFNRGLAYEDFIAGEPEYLQKVL